MEVTMTFSWKRMIILGIIIFLGGLICIQKGNTPITNTIDEFTQLVLNNQEYDLTQEELLQFKVDIQSLEFDKSSIDILQSQYFFLGYIENLLGNLEESKSYLKVAGQLGENSDPIIQVLMLTSQIKSYLQVGEKERAQEVFEEAIEVARKLNNDMVAKVYQAYARNRVIYNNEMDAAIQLMQEAFKIDCSADTTAYNHLYLSLIYLVTNDYASAIQESIMALNICEKNELELLKGASVKSLGDIYYVERKYNQAISIYEELLKGNYEVSLLNELTYLSYLADCYAMINQFDLAQEMIDKFIGLTSRLNEREAQKELNWIYLMRAKINILQSDIESAKQALGVARRYYNLHPDEMYANVDLWEQQLVLDLKLFENEGDRLILEAYIDVLEKIKARGVRDDLYYTIRDRIIYVGDLLGKSELTTLYRKEKIDELEKNEALNYGTELGAIIKKLHNEKSLKIILSWKALVCIVGSIALVILVNTIHIHLADRKIKKLNDILYQQSITDYLTKTYNKKYLYEYVKNYHEQSLICMLIDIDYFKLYNDTYGHVAGDKILEKVAQVLKEIFIEDAVFRYGGEEFCIISAAPIHEFEQNIKILYEKLAQLRIEHKSSKIARYLTVSAGVYYEELYKVDAIETILKQADEKLYQAKSLGRNQFVI